MNRKKYMLIILALLTGALMLFLSGCRKETSESFKRASIENPVIQKCWDDISGYWAQVNKEGFVNIPKGTDYLPSDLPSDDSLLIAVMGFALNKDGSMKDELVLRLICALNCARQYPEAYILVTGGGTAAENKKATEADKMAQWLVENGIDRSRIIIENKSLTTVENALYSYEIIKNNYPQITDIAIVTSDYHIPLSCLLFNSQFILRDYIDGNSKARVTANAAACPESPYFFSVKDQAKWLRILFERNHR